MSFLLRLEDLRARMIAAARRAGRDPAAIHLLAVSKSVSAEHVAEARQYGLQVFGESRVQEAEPKIGEVAALCAGQPPASWHFIGRLQRNKARRAVGIFDVIQSVDSLQLAREIEHAARQIERSCDVFAQINIDREPQKAGVLPEHAPQLLRGLQMECPHLRVTGLMAIPRIDPDPWQSRGAFARLRKLRDALREEPGGAALQELSMGMSHDFEAAIEEGATWIRVGTALFGERPHDDGKPEFGR
jgi:pyridoxal phosphate enzyme (YggS family)